MIESRTRERMTTHRFAGVCGVVILCAWSCAGLVTAYAQPPMPAPQESPVVEPPDAPDAPRPGFLDAIGRWLGDSKAIVNQQFKSTQDAIEGLGKGATTIARDAAGVARDAVGVAEQATGAVVGLPAARIVDGRERCALAPNGAPNCPPAAVAMCRGKGFASGRSVDIRSSEKCPAWVRWSGRAPAPGECTTETFVLRAVCQ
jgi:hypothetical protein